MSSVCENTSTDEAYWLLTNFIETLRELFQHSTFREKLALFNKSAAKNTRSLERFIDSMFETHARILVIRLDIAYKKEFYSDVEQDHLQILNDKTALFDYLRYSGHYPSFLNYCWKLEYGTDKNFHIHTILFFDASKVRQDVTIAQAIGEYWMNVITRGRGMYYNCNAQKELYKHLGIGDIRYNQTEEISNLKQYIARYITKSDPIFKIMVNSNRRTFGKGNIFKGSSGVGRPRTQSIFDQCKTLPRTID